MRILAASFLLAAACGGTQAKPESPLVKEGSDVPATCCCKTIPETAEKEIEPNFAMAGRMECSTQHGDCVDDTQCNVNGAPSTGGSTSTGPSSTGTGVPPPPKLPPSGG
jgi:hypothetical protein